MCFGSMLTRQEAENAFVKTNTAENGAMFAGRGCSSQAAPEHHSQYPRQRSGIEIIPQLGNLRTKNMFPVSTAKSRPFCCQFQL